MHQPMDHLRNYPKPEGEPVLVRDLEEIEADVRRAIAKAAAISVRGFDSLRVKREALAEADRLLDEYNEAAWLAEEA